MDKRIETAQFHPNARVNGQLMAFEIL